MLKQYLTSNSKLAKDKILAFSIPAYRSRSGFVTCPMAGTCANGCYARQGFFTFTNTQNALEERLEFTKRADFANLMCQEIAKRNPAMVRIHASGDFYSLAYFSKWMEIALRNPGVQFYAYTKMVKMLKGIALPANMQLIFSFGGKQDHLIDGTKDRHSQVFTSLAALKAAGYADVTTNDKYAVGPNHRIGLVYHGAAGKAWATA